MQEGTAKGGSLVLARRLKEKLRDGNVSIGSWMSLGHPSIAEIIADAGYDWVVIETEHTAIDNSEVLRLLMALEGRGTVPLVRLAGIDPLQAKAALDSGAAGVLVPLVNTKQDAELAVQMTRYPPLGSRGVGVARAHGYGLRFAEYMQRANDDTLLVVQIEHIDAVRNIDAILSVQGIDGTFIGPYDLSASMGVPGQLMHPDVNAAMQLVVDATRAYGLVPGIHLLHPETAVARLKTCVEAGYRFVALGSDLFFLGDSCRGLISAARQAINSPSVAGIRTGV